MNNVSKIVMLLGIVMISLQVNAQSFIIKGGLNMSNMTVKDNNLTYSSDFQMKPGFHVGVAAEMPLISVLYIEPGINFSTKGYKLESTSLGKGSYNLNYVDIPINFKLKFERNNVAFFVNAGPYFGIGINGKTRIEDVPVLGTVENDITFGENKDLKMLDYGVGFGGGFEYNSILLGVNYSLGVADISQSTVNDYTAKNSVLSLSVGYKL